MPPPNRDPAPDDEEDYMSMIIEEPQQKETFTQKKRRQQREAEARAKVPSKAELAAREAARRDEALATSTLDPSNKGFQMMAKLGFKPGQTLGKKRAPSSPPPPPRSPSSQPSQKESTDVTGTTDGEGEDRSERERARAEPLNLVFKEDRGGIGLDSEKKRKFREEAEEAVKKVKQEEGDYRDRVREERETRRAEAQFHAAQKVAERLDGEADAEEHGNPAPNAVKPTAQINLLYRGLVREREEKERSVQMRHLLQTSLPSSFFPNPRLPGYDDETLEKDDQEALGGNRPDLSTVLEQEVEQEDPELDEFNALAPSERLARIVQYLRDKHRYCFWCKYRYETDEMEGCPGVTEEDHD